MPESIPTPAPHTPTEPAPKHFIQQIVEEDLASGKHAQILTRFPPEPNGYLHLGHAKSICLNFGLAKQYGGRCNLRMDDTNPSKEDREYIDAIQADVKWLGFQWDGEMTYASETFGQLYAWAEQLVEAGLAYVDDDSAEEVSRKRGSVTRPGTPSAGRSRTPAENLDLLRRMKAGEFPNGSKILRAKIDLASPNMNLRDPAMYRIMHEPHPHVGTKWCIYPMYDYAHGQGDSLEKITHSICTLEFEGHRPLYEWFQEKLGITRTRQIEFARLNVTHMMMSKRKLLTLVQEKLVNGWDDPRMPTISGLRRRGYTPQALRQFCETIGIAKRENVIEIALLEHCLREDLNKTALRRSAVLDPIKVVLTNYPAEQVEWMEATNNPEDPAAGTRQVPFCRELYIEREDFMEVAPKKFFRLAPGAEVRLRYGYWITCNEVVKDANGHITELLCTYDPQTKGGNNPPPDAAGVVRKVKGTLHWVSARHAVDAEVRLYDHLFAAENAEEVPEGGDWRSNLNPKSLVTVAGKCEPALAEAKVGEPLQFERVGYFVADKDCKPGALVFNRTVGLKDAWAKEQKK